MTKIALIGRPNVGKSTLFNRLTGKKHALVHDLPGVTRDRRYGKATLADLEFDLIDTAGVDDFKSSDPGLLKAMKAQTEKAVQEADVLLFILDGEQGCTAYDYVLADQLRLVDKPIVMVVNKCEGKRRIHGLSEAAALGLGEPVIISALHSEGLIDLFDAIKDYCMDSTANAQDKELKITIVGRPNVGKSTLINQLVGEERVIAMNEPGTTRDAIQIPWHYQGKPMLLVDTAGMRRSARVDDNLEKLAVADTHRAIIFAEVVVVVIDALEGVNKQDLSIIQKVIEEGRALVVAVNKWDLVEHPQKAVQAMQQAFERWLPQLRGIQWTGISAKQGYRVNELMQLVLKANVNWNTRLPTGQLNRWFQSVVSAHPPKSSAGRLALKYITQIKSRPPTFALFASSGGKLTADYERYLQNHLRESFDLEGCIVRFVLRRSKNPYVK